MVTKYILFLFNCAYKVVLSSFPYLLPPSSSSDLLCDPKCSPSSMCCFLMRTIKTLNDLSDYKLKIIGKKSLWVLLIEEIKWTKTSFLETVSWNPNWKIIFYEQSAEAARSMEFFRVGSNGGSCLANVNTKRLGDFAENELASLTGLRADESGGKCKMELATDLTTWQRSSAPTILDMSVVNWVQPDMGIRWRDLFLLVFFFPFSLTFWLAFRFVDVSRSSNYCHS